jgi:hypothetical protein
VNSQPLSGLHAVTNQKATLITVRTPNLTPPPKLTFFIGIRIQARSRKPRLTAVGIRCADHATPSIRKSWH